MCSDENLVSSARQGDDIAMRLLVERYMKFAKEKAKRYVSADMELDDLVQECMLGFLSAFYSYNMPSEARFRTYVGVCMEHRVLSAISMRGRKKRIPKNAVVSLDTIENCVEAIHHDPEKLFFLRQQTNEILNAVNSELSQAEKEVFELYLKGKSYEEISFCTNRNIKSVSNALERIRKKLKKYM